MYTHVYLIMYYLGMDEAMATCMSICNGHSSILSMLCKIVNLSTLVKAPLYNHKYCDLIY